ncbi:Alkaline phosphatase [Candidatus Magnetoovum chiemensis]|nr:Alkaline phosphatase [Candidatus Magnetoovum chiemensis]
MQDNDNEAQNHVKVPKNECGGVYELTLGKTTDTTGGAINSDYAATFIKGIIVGKVLKDTDPDFAKYGSENKCHPDYISSPDNLGYAARALFIGEDTGAHLNDAIWAYDTTNGQLTRIATSPAGAEWTGAFGMLNAEGRFYIGANIQHPFGESNSTASGTKVGGSLDNIYTSDQLSSNISAWGSTLGYTPTNDDYRGYVGYIMGLPSVEYEY